MVHIQKGAALIRERAELTVGPRKTTTMPEFTTLNLVEIQNCSCPLKKLVGAIS